MRYRHKPTEVEAVQWTGSNVAEVARFVGQQIELEENFLTGERRVAIQTREGRMLGSPGDWIIRGVAKEFYPCKPEIFAETYEPVVE